MPTPSRLDYLCETTSLPEWITPYVAGLIDNHASLVVSISRASNRQLGYRPKQELRYKHEKRAVFDVLEQYCTDHSIDPRITEREGEAYQRYKFVLGSRSDIVDFLAPLRPYLLNQETAVTLLIESLIPGLNNGAHTERGSFLAWVRTLELFQEASGRANRAKYDLEYFCNEWEIDPLEVSPGQFEWGPDIHHKESATVDASAGVSDGTNLPEWIDSYIGALVDTHFNFVVSIGQDENRSVGFKVIHNLRYKTEAKPTLRVLEAYLTEQDIAYQTTVQDDTTYDRYELVINQRDGIRTLLESVRPYLIVRERAAELLLETILPALNAGAHSEQGSFVELMGDIDAFRDAAGRANRAQYDQEYFEEEWDLTSN
jgi:hypothetical protein